MKHGLKAAETAVAESEGFLMRLGSPVNYTFAVVSNFRQPKEYALLGFETKGSAETLMQRMQVVATLPSLVIPISADLEISKGKVSGQVSIKLQETEWHLANLSPAFSDFLMVSAEIAKASNSHFRARGSSEFEWLWKYQPHVPFSQVEQFPAKFRQPPSEPFRMLVLSWNLGGITPPPSRLSDELDLIFQKFPGLDLVLVCLQESCSLTAQNVLLNETEPGQVWASAFRKFPCLRGFESNPPESLVGLTSFFFVNEKAVSRVSDFSVCSVKTGLAGLAGNKGCVGHRFILDGRISIAALDVHFSSGDAMAETRKAELSRVGAEATFPGNFSLLENDIVIIAGDFNSRQTPNGGDELTDRLKDSNFLFEEPEISFKQTYKLIPGQEGVYVPERKPGWCDRVIFRATEGADLKCLEYNSLPRVIHSDHSPVYSVLEIVALQSSEICETRRLTE